MRLRTEYKGGDSTLRWLNNLASAKAGPTLNKIATEGESALQNATPVGDTGETARGWKAIVKDNEVGWVNNAHPHTSVNVAKIIHFGHGTGTGGYVPPRPYINTAMDKVFKDAGKQIAKEMSK